MRERYDVVILGGGLSGCSTAYHLMADPGFDGRVLVVERDPSYANAPSAKATGGIRQQFSTPENIRIGLYGARFAREADEHLGIDGEGTGILFREQGYLTLATPEALPVMEANHAAQRAEGAQIVRHDPAALAEAFPWLRCDGLAAGYHGASGEGWIDPYALLQGFRRKARHLGAEFAHDEAVEIEFADGVAEGVRLASGVRVGAGVVVNTAGASGVRRLSRQVGFDVPIESRLRVTFVFECRTDLSGAPLTILPNGVAWRPEGKGFVTNLAPPPERDPETFDFEIDYDQFEREIWPALAEWIPAFEAIKVTNTYACHYDVNLLDENAIIGRVPETRNVYIAAGFSGHGMQQSPAVGRALCELIVHGGYRSLDLGRFGPERILTGEGIFEANCW